MYLKVETREGIFEIIENVSKVRMKKNQWCAVSRETIEHNSDAYSEALNDTHRDQELKIINQLQIKGILETHFPKEEFIFYSHDMSKMSEFNLLTCPQYASDGETSHYKIVLYRDEYGKDNIVLSGHNIYLCNSETGQTLEKA